MIFLGIHSAYPSIHIHTVSETLNPPPTFTSFMGKMFSPLTCLFSCYDYEYLTVASQNRVPWVLFCSPLNTLKIMRIKIPSKILKICRRHRNVSYSHNNLATTEASLQHSLYQFTLQSQQVFLSLSSHKCKSMLFFLRPHKPFIAKVCHDGHFFDSIDKFKY